MILNSPFVTGSITVTDNIVTSGSLTVLGTINGAVTGSVNSASYAAYAAVANSASFASNATSSSFASTATSASQASNANTATSASFALTATSASQASNANTATSASQAANAVTSSYAANADLLDGIDSTRFAFTGSNTFTGTQYVSAANNATSFTSTASIYSDGGLRVTKDAYVSGTIYVNNLTVFGTQSINYITSSQLNIGTNIITVNTDTPAIRFGGLAVYDSGSTGLTGSMLWDSEDNHWVYSNPSGSSYDGGMMLSGPRNSSGLGNEQGTLNNVILKGQGGDHVTSSLITETGTATTFYTNALYVSSSNLVGIGTTSPTALLHLASDTPYIYLDDNSSSGTLRRFQIVNGDVSTTQTLTFGFNNTSGTSLTDVLSLNETGKAGIGTNAPFTTLHVNGTPDTNYGNQVLFDSRTATINYGGVLSFAGYKTSTSAANVWAQIAGRNEAGTGAENGYLSFITNTGSTYAERMRITSGGNVGIGTNSPNYSLHINRTDGSFFIGSSTRYGYFTPQAGTQNISYLQMRYDDNGIPDSIRLFNNFEGAGYGQGIAMYGAGDKVMGSLQIVQTDTSNTEAKFVLNLRNADASSTKVTILGNGNVGIGTTSPSFQLDLGGGTTVNTRLRLQRGSDDTNQYGIYGWNQINLYRANIALASAQTDFSINQVGSNGSRTTFYISSAGNIGIGTTNPASNRKLTVAGGAQFTGGDNSGASFNIVPGTNGQDGADFNLSYYTGTGYGPLTFTVGGSERMRITSGGNVLIGTTTDNGTSLLQVGSSSNTKISLTGGSSQNGMRWESVAGANAVYLFNGNFGPGPGWGLYNISSAALPFWILNSGAATFSSSVTVGGDINLQGGEINSTGRILMDAGPGQGFLFRTDNVAVSAMTILANGNVGIGATNPTQGKLVVSNAGPSVIANRETSVGVNSSWNASDGSLTFFGNESNHPLAFITNNGERMRITNGGNVGIGITNPGVKLEVFGTKQTIVSTDNGVVNITDNSGFAANSGGSLVFRGVYNSAGSTCGTGFIDTLKDNGTDGNFSYAMAFGSRSNGSSSIERMRITSGGNVLIGQTASSLTDNGWSLQGAGGGHTAFAINNNEAFIFNNRNSGTTYQIDFRTLAVERGAINVTDSGVSYTTASDYRLKEDLQPIQGLDKLSKINVYNFKFKISDERTDGVLAHELQEILPYAVYGEKDGAKYQGVDYSKIVPVLIQSIKELKAEIDILKSK